MRALKNAKVDYATTIIGKDSVSGAPQFFGLHMGSSTQKPPAVSSLQHGGFFKAKGNKAWCEKLFHVVSNSFFSEEMVNVDSTYKVGPRH